MTKRKSAGRSFFSNLPLDLRTSIKSQVLVPLIPGANINDHQPSSEPRDFLPTQPASPSTVADELDIPSSVLTADGQRHEAIGLRTTQEAETSTAGQKRLISPELSMISSLAGKKRKVNNKGKGKAVTVDPAKRFLGHAWDCTGLVQRYNDPAEVPSQLVKYWYQRQFLLPQYDTLPLLLDDTGWFSITPKPIAEHIAERCRCDVIIDAFCGVGGNAIEFAKTCERVIAIDNNPIRLRLARHNALHLGVADRIEFILGDYVSYAESLGRRGVGEEIDVVFLSPPWGGVDYLSFADPASASSSDYPLSAILPIHGRKLFDLTSTLTPNIAYYLPRNVSVDELGELARPVSGAPVNDGTGGLERSKEWVEVEEEWVGDKLKAVTAYYGGLIADEEVE